MTRRRFLKCTTGALLSVCLGSYVSSIAVSALSNPSTRVYWKRMGQPDTYGDEPTLLQPGLPGSVFKLVTAAALLESSVWQSRKTVECRGQALVAGVKVHCQNAHGVITLTEAVGQSCNVYFAIAAQQLNAEALIQSATRLKWPLRSVIEFKKQPMVLHALGLSDATAISAKHLLQVMEHLATDNSAMLPQARVLLRQGMHLAARTGTGRLLDATDTYRLMLKTGTTPYGNRFQSWVAGYFPREKPQYVICIRSLNGTSQAVGVPVLRQFLASRRWAISQ